MRLRARAAHFDAICRMVLRGAGLAVIAVRDLAQLPLPAQRLVAFLRHAKKTKGA